MKTSETTIRIIVCQTLGDYIGCLINADIARNEVPIIGDATWLARHRDSLFSGQLNIHHVEPRTSLDGTIPDAIDWYVNRFGGGARADSRAYETDPLGGYEGPMRRGEVRRDYVVATLDRSEWSWGAACYAVRKRAPLVYTPKIEQLEAMVLRWSPKYLAIVASPDTLTDKFLTMLMARLNRNANTPYWGLISGRDFPQCSRLIVKTALYLGKPWQRHLMIDRFDKSRLGYTGGWFTRLSAAELQPAKLANLLAKPMQVFSFRGHGREDLLFFPDGYVLPDAPFEQTFLKDIHSLSDDDGIVSLPWYSSERAALRASSVNAQIVFLNSCGTFKVGDRVYSRVFGVLSGFLDGGAAVVVASPTPKSTRRCENLLFHQLVHSGASVGKAVRYVNRLLGRNAFDIPSYLTLGDPEFGGEDRELPQASLCRQGEDKLHIHSTGNSVAYVTDLCARPDQLLASDSDILGVQDATGTLLVAPPPMQLPDRLEVRVVSLDERISRCRLAVDRLVDVQSQGVPQHVISGMLGEIFSAFDQAVLLRNEATVMLGAARRLENAACALEALIARADEAILGHLLDQCWEGDDYTASHRPRARYAFRWESETVCPYCGGICYEGTLSPWYGDGVRYLSQCIKCGTIRDRWTPALDVSIATQRWWTSSEPCNLKIIVRNHGQIRLSGSIGLTLFEGARYQPTIRPERMTLEVGPGTQTQFDVAISRPAEMPPGRYEVRVFAVTLGGITHEMCRVEIPVEAWSTIAPFDTSTSAKLDGK